MALFLFTGTLIGILSPPLCASTVIELYEQRSNLIFDAVFVTAMPFRSEEIVHGSPGGALHRTLHLTIHHTLHYTPPYLVVYPPHHTPH